MNESGITPQGDRVLVLIEEIELPEGQSILIPDFVKKEHEKAQMAGRLLAVGKDAWSDYCEPFASIGDRVMFGRWSGVSVTGKDGKEYRVMNDVDIAATLDEGVNFHDFQFPEKRKTLREG